jgi:hypothetical protein
MLNGIGIMFKSLVFEQVMSSMRYKEKYIISIENIL